MRHRARPRMRAQHGGRCHYDKQAAGLILVAEVNLMVRVASERETRIEELTDRRRPLFARLQSDPNATYLAIEIKAIDDQIAECNRQIQEDRKKAKDHKI